MSIPATPPRLLEPTAQYFYHDGAAIAKLSPHHGLKNAAIIYESIKNLPDKTIVRGDFDKKSKPFIFFPGRKTKRIGRKECLDSIKAKNIEAGKKEMGEFLQSIANEGINKKDSNFRIYAASIKLSLASKSKMVDHEDFNVGDIKNSLHVLANAYYLDEVRKKTSPHRLLGRQATKIQNKRLREFVGISKQTMSNICDALRKNHLKKYDVAPEMGLYCIKRLINQFLNQNSVSSTSFASFVRNNANDPNVLFFAQRWHAISHPQFTDERIQFSTEPWAKEIDKICEIILKSERRSMRLQKMDVAEDAEVETKNSLQNDMSKLVTTLPKLDNLPYSGLNQPTTGNSISYVRSDLPSSSLLGTSVVYRGENNIKAVEQNSIDRSSSVLPKPDTVPYSRLMPEESDEFISFSHQLPQSTLSQEIFSSLVESETSQEVENKVMSTTETLLKQTTSHPDYGSASSSLVETSLEQSEQVSSVRIVKEANNTEVETMNT